MAEKLVTGHRITPQAASASYRILRKLGKGGMAEVFLARQEGLMGVCRLTVIKRILPQFSAVPEVAAMLLDEARIAAQLTHPNIVQIYELGMDEGQYFIAMEFVDGCDLATLAREERNRQSLIPLRLTLRMVIDAATGLDYAHRQTGLDGQPLGIVHRDVSPHNIMCSREGGVKLTDFGIAKAVGKLQVTQVGVIKGKIHYMSPEQYIGGLVDHRSDIYSLGVILYQLTLGRLPRILGTPDSNIRRILDERIPHPTEIIPDYPQDLAAVVMRSLAQNPEDRYPSIATMRDDVLDFAQRHDLLSFPTELSEYINKMVTPVPLVVKEQSLLDASHTSPSALGSPDNPPELEDSDPELLEEPVERHTFKLDEEARQAGERVEQQQRADVSNVGTDPFAQRDRSLPDWSFSQAEEESSFLNDEPFTSADPTPQRTISTQRRRSIPEQDSEIEGELDKTVPQKKLSRITRIESKDLFVAPSTSAPLVSLNTSPSSSTSMTVTPVPITPTPIEFTLPITKKSRWGLWVGGLACLTALGTLWYTLAPRLKIETKANGQLHATPRPSLIGALQINSHPVSAEVMIGEELRCTSTPCQIDGLPLGHELNLTVKTKGYALWTQRVILTTANSKAYLNAYLTPQLEAMPLVDKKDARLLTPPDGGHPAAENLGAPGSEQSPADGRLAPLVVNSTKKSGPRKKIHPLTAHSKAIPTQVEESSSKIKTHSKIITTSTDSNEALLAADVKPWAEVWIDDAKIGHTPIQITVQPGRHKVELKNPDLNFSKTYRIQAKRKNKIKIIEELVVSSGESEKAREH